MMREIERAPWGEPWEPQGLTGDASSNEGVMQQVWPGQTLPWVLGEQPLEEVLWREKRKLLFFSQPINRQTKIPAPILL